MHRGYALIASFVSLGSLGLTGGCTWTPPQNIAVEAPGGSPGDISGVGGMRSPGTGGTGVKVDSGPMTPTMDANCGSTRNSTMRVPPDLLLVFDRSGSMAADPATGRNCNPPATCPSKWNQATAAVNTAVAGSQATIRWGLKLFSTDGNGCTVAPGAQVDIGLDTAPAIATALGGAGPAGSTPTTSAMTLAGDYLASLTTPNPRFIVLVTDGQPTCAAGNGNGDDSPAAVAAVAAQAVRGYGTFVIGVATANDAMATATLTQMSAAGLHPRAGTPNYYVVNNTAELVTALGNIGTQVASCTFDLASPPPDADNVVVLGDGKVVPRDALPTDNGWTYGAAMTSITLTGTYCQDVMDGVVTNVEALFGCDGIPPPIP
jgi:von Willebrand factor type A domain